MKIMLPRRGDLILLLSDEISGFSVNLLTKTFLKTYMGFQKLTPFLGTFLRDISGSWMLYIRTFLVFAHFIYSFF